MYDSPCATPISPIVYLHVSRVTAKSSFRLTLVLQFPARAVRIFATALMTLRILTKFNRLKFRILKRESVCCVTANNKRYFMEVVSGFDMKLKRFAFWFIGLSTVFIIWKLCLIETGKRNDVTVI